MNNLSFKELVDKSEWRDEASFGAKIEKEEKKIEIPEEKNIHEPNNTCEIMFLPIIVAWFF